MLTPEQHGGSPQLVPVLGDPHGSVTASPTRRTALSARHDELTAAWEAQTRRIEERTIAAVEDAYGVEVVQHWFVPDEGSDRVEVRLPDGRVADDCMLKAADDVLTLDCPGGR